MPHDYVELPEKPLRKGFDVLNGQIERYTHYVHRVMATFCRPMAATEICDHTKTLAKAQQYRRSVITLKIVRAHLDSMRKKHQTAEQLADETWQLTKGAISRLGEQLNSRADTLHAGEVPEDASYVEGSVLRRFVNAYERSDVARRSCIAEYGTVCSICEVDFSERYGPEVEGLIHVHHLKPLSEVGGEYCVDPVNDLRPVCPNCHAVIHFGGKCRSMDDVRRMLRDMREKYPRS